MSHVPSSTGGSNQPGGGKDQFNQASGNEPASNNKHQPGKLVGNDQVPEFSAETLPAGTAPAPKTFQPNPSDEAPPAPASGTTAAQDTIGGSTSADVHAGLGKPISGQSSKELHDGSQQRAGGIEGLKSTGQGTINPHDPAHAGQRALDKDEATIGRSDVPDAQERLPQSAESVASERP
ncbi:hypothetical protein CLAFUW4_03622 [Fulvia fulva]|uniref:Uncharacterized protein n=1 Tax=Passalora fulva TaxID=5499 RepID=A0A9Q8LAG3_PASFU|nr:uncharacterized protein CLAFUR5_03600 [Fulvia fulva]KAK4631499.1 hypothetical protein CLAFUR4_03610 [Fulvia fulva]KAK4632522.1 hypothetical protein CLAFUR0_03613 [Fulvia fulva]UJO13674.1 hypothetical protein CLAFUR5_03600 [Fulvia fulva]WPV10431.1 hypothetical protein CLAFUW4_03622 [Fulvia fulva]WPV26585.1 hypothetical protein CLAFUW7_03614 [Fulvia fulva]